jgi:hypothetical protein
MNRASFAPSEAAAEWSKYLTFVGISYGSALHRSWISLRYYFLMAFPRAAEWALTELIRSNRRNPQLLSISFRISLELGRCR